MEVALLRIDNDGPLHGWVNRTMESPGEGGSGGSEFQRRAASRPDVLQHGEAARIVVGDPVRDHVVVVQRQRATRLYVQHAGDELVIPHDARRIRATGAIEVKSSAEDPVLPLRRL